MGFDYKHYFDIALEKLEYSKRPRAIYQDKNDLNWPLVEENRLFAFEIDDLMYATNLYNLARNLSFQAIHQVIIDLARTYKKSVELLNPKGCEFGSQILFAVNDKEEGIMYFFKDAEQSSIWKNTEKEPDSISKFLMDNNCKKCIYVYMMFDKAYVQFIGYNEDSPEIGKGYNVYSLKDYISIKYGIEEWKSLETCLKDYIEMVEGAIGYYSVKSLAFTALSRFERIVQRDIFSFFPFLECSKEKVINKDGKEFELSEMDYNAINERFVSDNSIKVLFGNSDFKQSFITAEWLRESMKKAAAIDLTVVGMGYFKAVEQLLYEIILLRVGEKKEIKSVSGEKIELSKESVDNKSIDTTIGSMAIFIKDYKSYIFDNIISFRGTRYIIETIFSYKDLRNGYFHKHNITEWETIEEIRKKSIWLIFLLLGAIKLSEDERLRLSGRKKELSDFERLCEYVDAHKGNFFMIEIEGREEYCFGWNDLQPSISEDGSISYSGVYLKEVGPEGRVVRFSSVEKLPRKIFLARFGMGGFENEQIKMNPEKVRLIFEDGKYVGPKYADDLVLEY